MKKKIRARSGFEARVLKDLDRRKVKYEYEAYTLQYTKPERICVYTPDIVLQISKDKDIFVECKGNFTSKDRTKLLRVRDANFNDDIRLLFQRNNKLNKKSKIRYMDWAKKHGFECAVGESVPEEWIKK